jgi:addiction module RelE/StbE family toxin
MKLKWSPLAVERLTDIVNFISEDKPTAARNFADKILNSVEKLKIFPQSGRVVPELGKSKYRELIVGNYRVIYSISDNIIQIFTIRHAKQILNKEHLK